MFKANKGGEREMTQYPAEESVDRSRTEFHFEHLRPGKATQTPSWLYRFVSMIGIVLGHGDELVTLLASAIKPERIVWLWHQRIPVGRLTLFVGNPDNGKSMVATDVAARITTGRDWPDERNLCAASDVLIFADEDDHGNTTVPRLMAAGADLKRVQFGEMRGEKSGQPIEPRQMRLDWDLEAIERYLDKNPNIRAIVCDPVSNHFGDVNMNEEQSVRTVLTPLQQLAARRSVAIIGIMHLNKKADLQTINRIGGAMAFVGVARAVWLFTADQHEQGSFHMLIVKKNIGKPVGGLKYRIATREVEIDGQADQQPYVDWFGKSDLTVDDILESRQKGRPREARDEAKEWLKQYLADGPKPSNEVETACDAAGFSYRTIQRVKADEPNSEFECVRDGQRWYWKHRN